MSKCAILALVLFALASTASAQSISTTKNKTAVNSAALGFVQTQSDGNLTFKIVSVVGNKKSQIIDVTILVTNKGPNYETYNTRVESFVSDDGEEFKCTDAVFGSKASVPGLMLYTTLYTDVPLKTVYHFKGVLPKVSKIKILPLPYFDRLGAPIGKVEFRDLPINWK